MTLARRLAKLEDQLSPTQIVLRWLDEAHAHGSLDAYSDATLETEPREMPLDRLCREAEHAARASATSRDREQVTKAVRAAVLAAVFRFELVMRINVDAHDFAKDQRLYNAGHGARHPPLVRAPTGAKGRRGSPPPVRRHAPTGHAARPRDASPR